jgi:hypothetical protein
MKAQYRSPDHTSVLPPVQRTPTYPSGWPDHPPGKCWLRTSTCRWHNAPAAQTAETASQERDAVASRRRAGPAAPAPSRLSGATCPRGSFPTERQALPRMDTSRMGSLAVQVPFWSGNHLGGVVIDDSGERGQLPVFCAESYILGYLPAAVACFNPARPNMATETTWAK